MQRYFLSQVNKPTEDLELPKDIAHHLTTVLRAEVNTKFEIVLADEQVYLAHVTRIDDVHTFAQIDQQLDVNVELPVKVTIASGLPKGDKAELITQKATELGATRIVFFDTERSVAKWAPTKQARKIERLQKIASGAAEQSHRQVIPEIVYYNNLKQLLENESADVKIVAWEESAKQGEQAQLVQSLEQLATGQTLLTIFGSEGGLSEAEVEIMSQYQVVPAGLGPRILRTETAPLYVLSAISYHFELEK